MVELRPMRVRGGTTRSSAVDVDHFQHHAPSSDNSSGSVGARLAGSSVSAPNSSRQPASSTSYASSVTGGRADAAGTGGSSATGGAPATAATRLGRVIKKPVRLEEQNPGRQTLAGRNGRADAPARLAARAAVAALSAAAAAAATAEEPAAKLSSANGKVGDQSSGWSSAAAELPATGAGRAERCVARLGTAASNDSSSTVGSVGAGNKSTFLRAGSSNSSDSVGASKSVGTVAVSSSGGGSVVRMALPADGRTAGLPQRAGDADEAVGARIGGSGEPPRRSRYTVRERDRLIVPYPPPERPVRAFGILLDEAVKEYKRAYDNVRSGGHSSRGWIIW